MGKEVLLFSVNWMRRVTAIYLISVYLIVSPVFAEILKTDAKQDLILRTEQGDILLNPPKTQKKVTAGISNKNNKDVKTDKTNKQDLKVSKEVDDIPKPDKNYIDVYIGKCPFTASAVKQAKKFASEHKGYYVQYYGMKTNSNYEINPAEVKDIEIYLPAEAEKYDIKSVPSFVFNVNGNVYKVSGDVDLNEVHNEIISGKVKGEPRGGYVDLGVRGKDCKAVFINLAPQRLKDSDKQLIAREANTEPKIARIEKVFLPERSEPEVIDKKGFVNYSGVKKFIVFSESQTHWAKEMIKEGAAGCCTDCTSLKDMGSLVQFCTKELVESLGAKSAPTVININ